MSKEKRSDAVIDDDLELGAAIEADITEAIEPPGRKLSLSWPMGLIPIVQMIC